LVLFVDLCALGAVGAAKIASDYDSDGDADCQPYGDVAGGDAHRGADAGAESNTQDDLHGTSFHVSFLKIMTTTAGRGRPSCIGLCYFPLPSGFSVLSPI
jgi:hypothetical protein